MKLLLTSNGFENKKIGKKFIEIINKPASKIKIIFIPTASRTKEELKYVNMSKKEIIDLGIKEANIKTLNLNHKIKYKEIEDFDAIYVCGGNTFYLLHEVRESGFDKIIREFVKKGKLYVGVSAGSIIIGKSTNIALKIDDIMPYDENDIRITDFRGLGLIKEVISPHYKLVEKKTIIKYEKTTKNKVIVLEDGEALMIINDKKEIFQ